MQAVAQDIEGSAASEPQPAAAPEPLD
jgi:hypothetical protein